MNTCCTRYKGHSITTRWYENGPVSISPMPRFDACFRVDPDVARGDSWQVFLPGRFFTRHDAVANALAEAEQSVDLAIAVC